MMFQQIDCQMLRADVKHRVEKFDNQEAKNGNFINQIRFSNKSIESSYPET